MTDFERLLRALDAGGVEFVVGGGLVHPYLRGAPAGLPFRLDEPTLEAGLNFTLTTSAGELDLLGEVAGGGTYQALIPHSRRLDLLGATCWCVDLDTLIRLKQAAGRPKDFEALAELVALREERDRREPQSGSR